VESGKHRKVGDPIGDFPPRHFDVFLSGDFLHEKSGFKAAFRAVGGGGINLVLLLLDHFAGEAAF